MPTRRAWAFVILALVLYFLANQTQVGWVYVFTSGFAGLLGAAWLYTHRLLGSLEVKRVVQAPERNSHPEMLGPAGKMDIVEPDLMLPVFHEDDPIDVFLHLVNNSLKPALLVSGTEICPFAPVPQQTLPFFLPALFKGRPVMIKYQTICDRRGLYAFPPLQFHSRGAFGLFRTRRPLAVPGELLIYPSYHPLKHLRALERRELAEQQTMRAGSGSQVLGTREYRSGDSLRQIHWRSTARIGRLVVKEFAEDTQTSLVVVLDLSAGGFSGAGKFSTFETAVRIAASLAYYATRKHMPFYLIGAQPPAAGRHWVLPSTSLGWWAALNYLARVKNDGDRPLAELLFHLPRGWSGPLASTFLVTLVSRPDDATLQALSGLAQRGVPGLAVLITPDDDPLPGFPGAKGGGLEIKQVTPYNWSDRLAE